MTTIRKELVFAAINRAYALIDYDIQNNLEKQHEFRKQTVLADKSLTKDEKSYAIKLLNKDFDKFKICDNEGTKRICENCQVECLATLYCEHCVRNYLKTKFSNWTSGNNDIDNLIQKCQMETLIPDMIVEWIPYNNLQNIKYLTKGGCSEIYTAVWIDGCYVEWDNEGKKLKKFGCQDVVLKKLENVESANRSWFEEGKSHLTISSKYGRIVTCYGLTKDPSDGNYMLVMNYMDKNLREYLQQNKLTWKDRIKITDDIIYSLRNIHDENAIHRDLHSGNILFHQIGQGFGISDLGFCGPADRPLNSIYGNLPYIAPEVIAGKETTFASDIYSIGMLMWEISSGQPPFINYENDYDLDSFDQVNYDYNLAMKIINGMRPKIVSGTPLEYKKLIEQCWNADPTERPKINDLDVKIREMNKSYYQKELSQNKNESMIKKLIKKIKKITTSESEINTRLEINDISSIKSNYTSTSRLFTSKVYQFTNLPEPKNATEEEQEVFHSNPYSFNIPYNIDDLNSKNDDNTSKSSKDDTKILSKVFENMQLSSNNNIQNKCEKETLHQMRNNIDDDVDDEIFNNSNFHSEEQDELEIPDDEF